MLRNALRPVFSRLRAFWGTLIIKRAQPSLFLREPDGKLGALAQKRGFACARNLFHAFLGELTPAERRELRKTPLSALWAAQSEFSSLRGNEGHTLIKRRANSPFLQKPYGKLRALAQKRGFACARNLFHAFLGELTPAERRELRKTPLSALWAAQSEFSSLRGNEGHTLIKRRANSPFLRAAPRCKVKKAKAWFCLFRFCLERQKVANSPARRSARVPTHCHPERAANRM